MYKKKLGELLRDIKLLNNDQIEQALNLQKTHGIKFGDAVVKLGFLGKDDINWAIASQLNIPYIPDLEEKYMIDPKSVLLVPYEFAKRHALLTISQAHDFVNVVVADPLENEPIEEIEHISGKKVNLAISDEKEILRMIEYVYRNREPGSLGNKTDAKILDIRPEIYRILKDVGPGFEKLVYKNAICMAFEGRYAKNVNISLFYRGAVIGNYLLDILIDDSIGVILAEDHIEEEHIKSVMRIGKLRDLIAVKIKNGSWAE